MRLGRVFSVIAVCFFVSACSWFGGDEKRLPDIPEQQLYDEAITALEQQEYETAVEKLQMLEARYPFGRYSEQAQLELIFAYHKNFEPEAARAAADRFIRLHPSHENIDYAHYLKGLTAFEQDQSMFQRFLPIDIDQRDPGAARSSFESFSTLINRYPDSSYAPDAQKRMLFLKNRLASYEVHVANYYMKRGAYIAAANRGRYVVENLKETPATPDALAVMYQAYELLGEQQLAQSARDVLLANYPNYPLKSYKVKNTSLLETATFGLFGSENETDSPPRPTAEDKQGLEKPDSEAQKEQEAKRPWYHKATFGIFE